MKINRVALDSYLSSLKLTTFEWIFIVLPVILLAGFIIFESIRRKIKGEQGIKASSVTTFKIDLYAHESKLCRLNAGLKIIFSLVLLLMSVILNNIGVSILIIFFCAFVTTAIGGLSFREYLRLLTIPLAFLILSSIIILLTFSTKAPTDYLVSFDLQFFYVSLTSNSINTAVNLWCRAFGAVSAMYMMTLSTPSNELFSALEKAHCPSIIVELMNMMYRFIFTMMNTASEMKTAAESRLGYVNYRTAIKSFGQIGSNILIVSLKKARSYYDALDSRLYNGKLAFLEEEKKAKPSQILLAVGVVVYLIFVYIGTRYFK